MMDATQRDGELVADPTAKGARLSEAEIAWVARSAATHEARLPCNKLAVLRITRAEFPSPGPAAPRSRKGCGILGHGGRLWSASRCIIVGGIEAVAVDQFRIAFPQMRSQPRSRQQHSFYSWWLGCGGPLRPHSLRSLRRSSSAIKVSHNSADCSEAKAALQRPMRSASSGICRFLPLDCFPPRPKI